MAQTAAKISSAFKPGAAQYTFNAMYRRITGTGPMESELQETKKEFKALNASFCPPAF